MKVATILGHVVKIQMGLHQPHVVSLQGYKAAQVLDKDQTIMVSQLELHAAPLAAHELTIGRRIIITIEVADD